MSDTNSFTETTVCERYGVKTSEKANMHNEHWLTVRVYGAQYSATRQFFSTTALHLLRRGFCTLVLFIKTCIRKYYYMYMYIVLLWSFCAMTLHLPEMYFL